MTTGMLSLLLLLAASAFVIRPSSAEWPRLVERKGQLKALIMQQSCYYQEYNKRLTCKCQSTDTSAYLNLRMKYYVFRRGNEIRSVHLEQCNELLVSLDLRDVDATNFPVHFRAVRKVEIEKIVFEPKYSDRQELQLVFNNVETVRFENLFVEDTLKLRATNVKELHFVSSTFAHIPRRGFEISRARILDIRDSSFLRISSQSVVVEQTKEVKVLKNEMAVNALEAVYAKDGSHLIISCNRLLNHPVSPECSRTTTTTTTTTPPPYLYQDNLREKGKGENGSSGGRESIVAELIGGVVAGIVVITALILFFLCAVKRRRKDEQQPQQPQTIIIHVPAEPKEDKKEEKKTEDSKESDLLLGPEDLDGDDDEEEEKHKARPVWLEEIQKNRIFNKQKSLLSEEGLKEIAEGTKDATIPEKDEEEDGGGGGELGQSLELAVVNGEGGGGGDEVIEEPSPNKEVQHEEVRESSRTESDEEFHAAHAAAKKRHAPPPPTKPKPKSPTKSPATSSPPPPAAATPSPPPPPPDDFEDGGGNDEKGDDDAAAAVEKGMTDLLEKVREQELSLLE